MTNEPHELTIKSSDIFGDRHFGTCTCGWTCERSRERDVRRMHRTHTAEIATAELFRKMNEKTS